MQDIKALGGLRYRVHSLFIFDDLLGDIDKRKHFIFEEGSSDEANPVVRQSSVAGRLLKIKPSSIRRMFSVTQHNSNVISLGIGEPDFTSPAHVLDAAKQALDHGKTHYPPSAGIQQLREALGRKAKRDYNLTYDPTSEILVTVGATQAVFLASMAFVDDGDEVVLFDPGFVGYEPDVLIAGGVPASVSMDEQEEYRLDVDAVMSHITDRTRVIIINSPNNPTGAVFSYHDLSRLAKLVIERDLIVISDEVYEKIVYDDAKHFCFAAFPGMRDRTIVVNSFSKTYAMTGFRVGYAMGPKELIDPMLKVHQYSVACVDGTAQYAALAALEGSQKCVKSMISEFDRRRRLIYKRIKEIEGFSSTLPKGAFYLFVNAKTFGIPTTKLADLLAKEGHVVTVPGSAFGVNGEGYLRLSYATTYEKIAEAMDRIERVVKEL